MAGYIVVLAGFKKAKRGRLVGVESEVVQSQGGW